MKIFYGIVTSIVILTCTSACNKQAESTSEKSPEIQNKATVKTEDSNNEKTDVEAKVLAEKIETANKVEASKPAPEPLPEYHPDSNTTAAEVGSETQPVEEDSGVDAKAKIPASEQY